MAFQDRQQIHSEADCRFLFEVSYLKQSLGKSRNVTQWATKPPPIEVTTGELLPVAALWQNVLLIEEILRQIYDRNQ